PPPGGRAPQLFLGPGLALLPARGREDGLEAGLGRQVPRPDRVLLVVPPDLGDHAGGQLVLAVGVGLDALVVDDHLIGLHVRLVGRLGERRRVTDLARLMVSAIQSIPVISRMASSPMSWPRLYFL